MLYSLTLYRSGATLRDLTLSDALDIVAADLACDPLDLTIDTSRDVTTVMLSRDLLPRVAVAEIFSCNTENV